MSNYRAGGESEHGSDEVHFEDLEDGAGCTEIWEHLSEQRERSASSDD